MDLSQSVLCHPYLSALVTHSVLLMNATVKTRTYFTAMITLAASPLKMSVMGFRTAGMEAMNACAVMSYTVLSMATSTVSPGANTVLEEMACMHSALRPLKLTALGLKQSLRLTQ